MKNIIRQTHLSGIPPNSLHPHIILAEIHIEHTEHLVKWNKQSFTERLRVSGFALSAHILNPWEDWGRDVFNNYIYFYANGEHKLKKILF